MELTAAQARMRDWIAAYIAEHGYSPSIREIGSAVGIASPNGVECHLQALERKGAINRKRIRGQKGAIARTIRIAIASEDQLIRDAAADLLAACESAYAECVADQWEDSSLGRKLAAAIKKARGK